MQYKDVIKEEDRFLSVASLTGGYRGGWRIVDSKVVKSDNKEKPLIVASGWDKRDYWGRFGIFVLDEGKIRNLFEYRRSLKEALELIPGLSVMYEKVYVVQYMKNQGNVPVEEEWIDERV